MKMKNVLLTAIGFSVLGACGTQKGESLATFGLLAEAAPKTERGEHEKGTAEAANGETGPTDTTPPLPLPGDEQPPDDKKEPAYQFTNAEYQQRFDLIKSIVADLAELGILVPESQRTPPVVKAFAESEKQSHLAIDLLIKLDQKHDDILEGRYQTVSSSILFAVMKLKREVASEETNALLTSLVSKVRKL